MLEQKHGQVNWVGGYAKHMLWTFNTTQQRYALCVQTACPCCKWGQSGGVRCRVCRCHR